MTSGCSDSEPSSGGRVSAGAEQSNAPPILRLCYRNEFPFQDDPGQMDVQSLTLSIEGNHVEGEYNWLPAFKDRRVGQFEGTVDGELIDATYEYSQEGESASTGISIRMEPEQIVVEGGASELGLDATIARVQC